MYRISFAALSLTLVAGASAATVSYPNFNTTAGLTINGAAAGINTGGQGVLSNGNRVLRLTNDFNQGGSAFTTSPVSLASNASFSTAFSFQISNSRGIGDADGAGADGLCFVVQSVANNVGASGGGIGYQGISNSVAIEFDTYNNGGVDHDNGNHIGVDFNGDINSVAYSDIATRMNDGNVWYSWVDYNGATNTLEVRVNSSNARPASAIISYQTDLTSVLGQTNAFVGFTSGTGSGAGEHDILSWELENTFAPIGTIPLPSAAGLGFVGFGAVALRRSRRR